MSMDVIQTFNIEDRFMQVIEALIRAQRAFFHTSVGALYHLFS